MAVAVTAEYAARNAMDEPEEIERFYDRCSEKMRELFDGLALAPDRPRPFPEIVLGGSAACARSSSAGAGRIASSSVLYTV